MRLVLLPFRNQNVDLQQIYERAFSEATELYILSAYLTKWDYETKLNPNCSKFRLIVGTDFGITRKQALEAALSWLPNDQKCNFLAVDNVSGFHPKAAFWKDATNNYHCVIGSSNQTNAAFSTNYEANVFLNITKDEFLDIFGWIMNIEENCSQINEYWIQNYKERKIELKKPKPKGGNLNRIDTIKVSSNVRKELNERRKKMEYYAKIRSEFINLVEDCAEKRISSSAFYRDFTKMWTEKHQIFFQSSVWKISGKNSDFSQACSSFIKIINSQRSNIDDITKIEMDKLEELKNPTKKSLFTELLCKEFPNQFPVWNGPIERYLKSHNLEFPRKSSFGSKYIHMAREMRKILKSEKLPVNNLAELDLLIGLENGWN